MLIRKSKKVNKKSRARKSMPKKRRTRTVYRKARSAGRRARGVTNKITSKLKNPMSGIGGGIVTEAVVERATGPSMVSQLAGYGGAYLFGGSMGVIGKVAFDVLTGRGLPFGTGGGGSNSGGLSL